MRLIFALSLLRDQNHRHSGGRLLLIILHQARGLSRIGSENNVDQATGAAAQIESPEERILPPEVLRRVTLLRRSLVSLNPVTAMESLVQQLAKYPSNQAFLEKVGTFIK